MNRFATSPLRLGVLLAGLLLIGAPPPVAAQSGKRGSKVPFAFQSHVFRRILFDMKFQALKNFDELNDHPDDAIVILLGDTSPIDRRKLGKPLRDFVSSGGAILIATDRRPGGQALVELAPAVGVTFADRTFLLPLALPLKAYRSEGFCPFLIGEPTAEPDLLRGPRLGSASRLRVATNAPSCLFPTVVRFPDGIRPLAWLQPDVQPEGGWPRGWPQGDASRGPLFAVGGEIGDGRILVLADHSIFINQMMLPEDNNNVEFTSNCLAYLRGEEPTSRKYVLLVEDGEVRTDLEVPLKPMPDLPPARILLAYADQVLGKLEEKNAFNHGLEDLLTGPNHDPRRARLVLRVLVTAATLLVLLYVAYRVGIRGRFKLDTAVPLLAKAVVKHTPAGTLLEQRRAAALAEGNVWETARGLAREWAAALPASRNGSPPRLSLRGSWWQRWGLRLRFERLWKLAHDTEPTPVSPHALRRLLADLARLRAAQADGSLALTPAEARA
jgi:hypothetical protein